jgi:hypothetical protein
MLVGDTGLDVVPVEALPELPGLPPDYHARGKADALQVPEGYMGVVNERIRTLVIITRWGKVIDMGGSSRLFARFPVAGASFVSPYPADQLYFPKSDAFRPGQPRYDWFADDKDGGVKYGFLKFKGTKQG